MFILFSCL